MEVLNNIAKNKMPTKRLSACCCTTVSRAVDFDMSNLGSMPGEGVHVIVFRTFSSLHTLRTLLGAWKVPLDRSFWHEIFWQKFLAWWSPPH